MAKSRVLSIGHAPYVPARNLDWISLTAIGFKRVRTHTLADVRRYIFTPFHSRSLGSLPQPQPSPTNSITVLSIVETTVL